MDFPNETLFFVFVSSLVRQIQLANYPTNDLITTIDSNQHVCTPELTKLFQYLSN